MAILNIHEIDVLGISDDKRGLILMLTDYLEWLDEYQHLMLLQDKISAYIVLLEMEQYNEVYPNNQFEYCIIEIYLKNKSTLNARRFFR